MVVSNPGSAKRIHFFEQLNKIKKVDSGGRYLNTIGGPVPDKLEFIKDYRFVISFENTSYPGYTTEKILEPIITDSIPIYWGNTRINEDFNEKRFLNYDSFINEAALIEKIIALENDPEKAIDMIMQSPFPNGFEKPSYIQDSEVLIFFESIVKEKGIKVPVATTYKRYIHFVKTKINRFSFFLRGFIRFIKQ